MRVVKSLLRDIKTKVKQEVLSWKKLSIRPEHIPVSKQSSGVGRTDDSLSVRLTRIFMGKGYDISPSQVHALEAELTALGMKSSEINGDIALRALLLQRHSILLTRELLTGTLGKEAAIFKNISEVMEQALSLLGEKHLSAENRKAVGILARDITALFRGTISPESMKFMTMDSIELWAYSLESKLISILEGHTESAAKNLLNVNMSEVELALESLLSQQSENLTTLRAGPLVDALRNAVSQLRAHVQEIDFSKPGVAAILKEAINALENRLYAVAGEYQVIGASEAEQQQLSMLIAELLKKNVRILEDRLWGKLFLNSSEGDMTGIMEGAWRASSLIQKSGMGFEWQLLAWYRSGMDPARLHALLHDDLKGILMGLANRSKKSRAKGRVQKKLELLGKLSNTVIKNISDRQVSNILNAHDKKHGIFFELPLGEEPGLGHAKVEAGGNKESRESAIDPQNFTLSFEIETSRIGTVIVFMTVSGKSVSLRFELEDKTVSALGMEMREEIRDGLMSRGFAVGAIEFCDRDSKPDSRIAGGQPNEKERSAKNLDIIG